MILAALWRHRASYLFLLPTFLFLAVFNYLPALSGLYHAFTEWETGGTAHWIGLDNFRQMAGDEFLRLSIVNQVILLIANLIKTLVVPLIVAEMLFHLRSKRLQYALRTTLLIPMVVPGMVGVLLWGFIYDPNIGLLNNALTALGLKGLTRAWLGDWHTALPAVIGVGFPWISGLALLIYLAGLIAIPQDVLDSCAVDGASGWKRIWNVDLPLLRGQMRLLAALTIIGTLQDFGSLLVLTGGGPGLATHVPALHMYYEAFRFGHYGYASAIGFVLFLTILAFTVANMRFARSAVELG
ncbi:MAG TPA: sugar ABC transporter permease [Chthonomonadaceae bacterium]|nr:sugar ABC transporter permease [Chthonomonadaceae bacterium]